MLKKGVSPLSLGGYLHYLVNTTLKRPLQKKKIRRGGIGKFYNKDGDPMEDFPSGCSFAALPDTDSGFAPDMRQPADFAPPRLMGGALGACGAQRLPIIMEKLPTSFWSYATVNRSMATWNRFMNIYRPVADDGKYGRNDTNEFGGFADNATLKKKSMDWNGEAELRHTL